MPTFRLDPILHVTAGGSLEALYLILRLGGLRKISRSEIAGSAQHHCVAVAQVRAALGEPHYTSQLDDYDIYQADARAIGHYLAKYVKLRPSSTLEYLAWTCHSCPKKDVDAK